jgi:phosphoribosylformylglycinamidine synthase
LAGAAFASRELTEESKEDRPAVQVGDPFKEKLLLEACLELLATDAVAGIQDMGAAGLTCSTCETASRGGSGVQIDLAKVPKRETGMTPYEILLSESQERMLIIARRGREDVVREVFSRWEVPCEQIGEVTADGMMRVLNHGEVVAEIPAKPLADEAPLYAREFKAPAGSPPASALPAIDLHQALDQLLGDPTIASKNWVYRQYDHTVRTGTMVAPGSDAAVFYVRYADKILAATSDCNSMLCALDPREGARHTVAEGARNLTCAGALPLAVTDNLNFGNPYKPENFWQLREAVEGMAEACQAFGTPVVGGNVSLYNESPAGVVDPTPTVGMVGLIEQQSHVTTQWFKHAGDTILLFAAANALQSPSLGASRFLKVCHGQKAGPVPRLDIKQEIALQAVVRDLIQAGLIKSAHDCSEGGLAVALAECCFNPDGLLGAECDLSGVRVEASTDAALLFNEAPSRIVVSVATKDVERVRELIQVSDVKVLALGHVGGDALSIKVGQEMLRWEIGSLHDQWWNSIARAMGDDASGNPLPSL